MLPPDLIHELASHDAAYLVVVMAVAGNANKTAELSESETQRFVRELQGKRGELEKQLSDFRQEMNTQAEARRSKIAE